MFAYSHDGYGLGHLRRNLRIVDALREIRPDVEVAVASGAPSAATIVGQRDIRLVQLPPLVKIGAGRYETSDNGAPGAVLAERAAWLDEAVRAFAPDLVLVDRHPRGLNNELEPALRALRTRNPIAQRVLGLRDILDEPEAVSREWAEQDFLGACASYDAILCYGDPAVFDPVQAYSVPPAIASRITFTGYLLAQPWPPTAERSPASRRRVALCTLGGGMDGALTATAFLDAMPHLAERGWRGLLITGPYMADAQVDRLVRHPATQRGIVAVQRLVPDVPAYMRAADAVFAMAGYNTSCELLAAGTPAVVVPRVAPRREQQIRAQVLAERGLLHWLHPAGLTPLVVAGALDYVSTAVRADATRPLAGDGLRLAARALADRLPAQASVPTSRVIDYV